MGAEGCLRRNCQPRASFMVHATPNHKAVLLPAPQLKAPGRRQIWGQHQRRLFPSSTSNSAFFDRSIIDEQKWILHNLAHR